MGAIEVRYDPFYLEPRPFLFNLTWRTKGSELFSVSSDGQVLWWDIRKLAEPTESMLLDPDKNGQVVGGTVIDYETTMVRT